MNRFFIRFTIFVSLVVSSNAIAEPLKVSIESEISGGGEVIIDWKIDPKIIKKGDELEILRRFDSKRFVRLKTIRAKRKGSWTDKVSIEDKTDYKIRLVQNGSRVKYSHIITVVPLPEEEVYFEPSLDLTQLGDPIITSPNIVLFRCPGGVEVKLLEIINAHRLSLGLNILVSSQLLTQASEVHSQAMAERFLLSHDNWYQEIENTGYKVRYAGQNIARYPLDPQGLFLAWLESQGHKEVMEADLAKDAGISCLVDTKGFYWWTLSLGASF